MTDLRLTLGALIAVMIVTGIASSALAHHQSETPPLIGTWILVSLYNIREDGSRFSPVGSNPKGILIYDATGRMSVQIMGSERARFAAGNFLEGTAEENKAAVHGTISYFGTYVVDEASHIVTHHIEGSLFPNWDGTDQRRTYTFVGDELKLTTPPVAFPGGSSVGHLVWKRAK
ncbi:MAG TPA: lipocalin-like domain-containing protein [Candidatus Dormibacteraeota bacterium]|nr:lipocalin-like domain-containing protein [Candidatus Dormibacteraeota bacterium]